MPTSDKTSLDDLISHLIAALHASQLLHMEVVEKLLRMSLIELGRSIANAPMQRTQKSRKKKLPSRKKTVPAPRELSLVAAVARDSFDAAATDRNETATLTRRLSQPPIPPRRLPPRRSGSRG